MGKEGSRSALFWFHFLQKLLSAFARLCFYSGPNGNRPSFRIRPNSFSLIMVSIFHIAPSMFHYCITLHNNWTTQKEWSYRRVEKVVFFFFFLANKLKIFMDKIRTKKSRHACIDSFCSILLVYIARKHYWYRSKQTKPIQSLPTEQIPRSS